VTSNPSIFAYASARDFLRDVLAHKKSRNQLFSIRAWSKQMGFPCHTSLVFLLSGKRRVRPDHLEKLNRGLRLAGDEEKYFRLLVQRDNALTPIERAEAEAHLGLLRPSREQLQLEQEKFLYVAEWLHMAILEMCELEGFRSSPTWIAERLGGSATPAEVSAAIRRLVKLELLKRDGVKLLKTHQHLTTAGDRASAAIREHHKQVLALAARAVDEQTVEERILNSSAFTIDTARLPEAKQLIVRFRAEMAKLLEKSGGDETYELSVQLFRLTKKELRVIQ
jgi:uncharacterized protein (TIGR02147 family)